MRKILTITLIIISTKIYAQVTDSISMDPNYTNEIFWSLEEGNKGSDAINTWELAFRTGLQTSSIFINSANGVSLYHDPNVDTSGWATLDTTGLLSWQELFNSDTSWEFGAFDRSSTGFPDFSWGDYDNNTHIVTGDSLYVIKLTGSGSTVYKKLWIINKDFGNWTFRYANLDNTGDQTVTITGEVIPNSNFTYYSITNGQTLDLEPDNNSWDILFTRYLTLLPPDNTPYLVTGVLNNVGVQAAQASGVDVTSVNESDYSNSYTHNISEIGYDWKYFDMTLGQYFIKDSLCYFVKAKDADIYKIVFSSFEGATTGTISWQQTFLLTGISNLQEQLESAAVYPNPIGDQLSLIFSMKKSSADINFDLINTSGETVLHTFFEGVTGLNQKTFQIPNLSNGLYLLKLTSGKDIISLKVLISK